MQGITDFDTEFCIDEIIETKAGGTYFMNNLTVELCKTCWIPTGSTQDSYDKWEENGCKTLTERASEHVKQILDNCPEMILSKEKDVQISQYIRSLGYSLSK